ncbi:MAG: hypothetical protein NT094_05130 [Candidatus Staskawiczbacteria bacterium]|nr:hypothetical protein [Candidatus Staskawiczbacteria bacterium]
MNTITASMDEPQNIYWPPKYLGEEDMISEEQQRKLTNLIYANIQDSSECELRCSQLENLTSVEAENYILDFSFARWK